MGFGGVKPPAGRGADRAIRAFAWTALLLALYGLYVGFGYAGTGAARWWITSDSLYPVHVFIDTVLEGNPFSGWKFSVAPCWFPDIFLASLFMLLTKNAIAATLLAGFVQAVLLVLGLRLLFKTAGWEPGVLPEVGALAALCVAALRVAAAPDASPGQWQHFFLPQTHLGSLLLTVYALVPALRLLRDGLRLVPAAAYGVLCFLGAFSDLLFVVQTMAPLTAVLAFAALRRALPVRAALPVLLLGWVPSMAGYAINAYALNTTSFTTQSDRRIGQAFLAFFDGFFTSLARLDLFHLAAVAWLVLTLYGAWKGLRAGADARQWVTGVVLGTLGLAVLSSIGAVIVGASTTLTQMNNYPATLRYLHPGFLLPVVALPFATLAVVERKLASQFAVRALAGAIVFAALIPSLAAARRSGPGYAPFTEYRYPVGELLDELAAREQLRTGVAGYWQARPITLLSRSGVRAYAVTPVMEPFLWVSNREWYRPLFDGGQPRADFVVLDDPLFKHDAPRAVDVFGVPKRVVTYSGTRVLLYRCNTCAMSPEQRAQTWMAEPLTEFGQRIASSTASLELKPGQQKVLDVEVTNPGREAWASTGRWPVNLACRIFANENLVGECERTGIPGVLAGGASIRLPLRVTAPGAGQYTVRVSAVQEQVGWMMDKGGAALEIPLTVR